jgi:hypothetical protein
MEQTLTDLHDLVIHAEKAEAVTWQGRQALRLENGLALVPESGVQDASIEVMIGTEGPAYPGVAFRLADVLNYELAYAVRHVRVRSKIQLSKAASSNPLTTATRTPCHTLKYDPNHGAWCLMTIGNSTSINIARFLVQVSTHITATGYIGNSFTLCS